MAGSRDALRRAANLAAWEGVIGEVWDGQKNLAKIIIEIHIPYFVNAAVPTGSAMRALYDDWSIPENSISEDPDTIKRLLEDPKFRVLAEIRYSLKRHLTGEFEGAIAAAEAILSKIETRRWHSYEGSNRWCVWKDRA